MHRDLAHRDTAACVSVRCGCSNRKLRTLRDGIPTHPLPAFKERESRGEVPHAPRRGYKPTLKEKKLALKNALRYA